MTEASAFFATDDSSAAFYPTTETGKYRPISNGTGPNRWDMDGEYGGGGRSYDKSDYVWPRRWTISCVMILGVGFVGNFWVLYTGFRKKTTRNSPFHLLLMNHSLSCVLLGAFAYPISLHKGTIGILTTDLQTRLCHYGNLIMMWWVCAGLLSNGVVAVNRALSCFPHQTISNVLRGRRATWATIAMIWIVSFLVYGVPAFAYPTGWVVQLFCLPIQDYILKRNHPEVKQLKNVVPYATGLSVLVALAMSFASYIVIIWRLYGQEWVKCGGKNVKTFSAQRKKEKLHALGVIAIVFTTFCVCWVPFMWVMIWERQLITVPVFSLLPMLETALNPLLYMVTMPVFRPDFCSRSNMVIPHATNTKKESGPQGKATSKATSESRA